MPDAPLPQRRRFPRYPCDLAVMVYQGTNTFQARLQQLSRGGCLIVPAFSAGSSPEIKLSFRISEDLPPINCKGEVVYSINDRGAGVAFTEISLHNQDLITGFFEQKLAADPKAASSK
jgi:hypothetical protein